MILHLAIQFKHEQYIRSRLNLVCFSFMTGHFGICVFCKKAYCFPL